MLVHRKEHLTVKCSNMRARRGLRFGSWIRTYTKFACSVSFGQFKYTFSIRKL